MNRIAKFYKVSKEQFGRDCYENIMLPTRATAGSAGYDFIAPYDFTLNVGEEIVIDTGIRAKIADGWVLVILPRSGSGFKFGVRLANTAGVIDSDYFNADNEGHIKIKLVGATKPFNIKAGDAFAQGIFLPYGITEDDNCTAERHGGFGSTSK